MNDNNKPAHALIVGAPFIVREGDKLAFVGLPTDPRAEMVERLSAGHGSQADIDGVSDLPVFDEEAINPDKAWLFVVERVGKCMK